MFHRGQRTVQQLRASARLVSDMELRLNHNITSSVARSLQELSSSFRSSQSAYLKSTYNHSAPAKLCSFFCINLLFRIILHFLLEFHNRLKFMQLRAIHTVQKH